jgi:hypothetical protein
MSTSADPVPAPDPLSRGGILTLIERLRRRLTQYQDDLGQEGTAAAQRAPAFLAYTQTQIRLLLAELAEDPSQQGLAIGRRCRLRGFLSDGARRALEGRTGAVVGFVKGTSDVCVQLEDGPSAGDCLLVPQAKATLLTTGPSDASGSKPAAAATLLASPDGSMTAVQRVHSEWMAITDVAQKTHVQAQMHFGRKYVFAKCVMPMIKRLMSHRSTLFPNFTAKCARVVERALSGARKQGAKGQATSAAVANFQTMAAAGIVPLASVHAVALHPDHWMPQVRAPLSPLGTDARPYVFAMVEPGQGTPHYAAFRAAHAAARRHVGWVCNGCDRNMSSMLSLVDATGCVTSNCLAGNRSMWASAVRLEQLKMLRNAVFVPLFLNDDRTGFVPSPATANVSFGGGALFYRAPPAGTEIESYPVLIAGPGGFPRIDLVPMTHVCLDTVLPASDPTPATLDAWPAALRARWRTVQLFVPAPKYVGAGLQYQRRMAEALGKMTIPAGTKPDAVVDEQLRQMLQVANKWELEAGQSTAIAADKAEGATKSLKLQLNWRTGLDETTGKPRQLQVFDLDMQLYYFPDLGGGVGTAGTQAGPPLTLHGGAGTISTRNAPVGVWSCRACTFQNAGNFPACSMCGTAKGAGSVAAPPALPSPAICRTAFLVAYDSGHKYLCTACLEYLPASSGGVCHSREPPKGAAADPEVAAPEVRAPKHGADFVIGFRSDARHPVAEATEEIDIGFRVRGFVLPAVSAFNTLTMALPAGSSQKEPASTLRHVFARMRLRVGRRRVLHGAMMRVPRNPSGGCKQLYDVRGLMDALASAVGFGDGAAEADALGDAACADAKVVTPQQLVQRLATGAAIRLPLSEEFFDDNAVRRLSPAESAAARARVSEHFGGAVTAVGVPLKDRRLQRRLLWSAHHELPPADSEFRGLMRARLLGAGLSPDMVEHLVPVSSASVDYSLVFGAMGQPQMCPAMVLEYRLNGAALPPPQQQGQPPHLGGGAGKGATATTAPEPRLAYGCWFQSGQMPRDASKPAGSQRPTGMFTPEEWARTVECAGLPGATTGVRLTAITRMPGKNCLFFHVAGLAHPAPPSTNGYSLQMPTEPLAPYVSGAVNRKQLNRSLQQLQEVVGGPLPAFGFVVQPGMQFHYYAGSTPGTLCTARLDLPAPSKFRPARYDSAASALLAKWDWAAFERVLQAAMEQTDTPSFCRPFQQLGAYMTRHPPTAAAERRLTVAWDVYNLTHDISEADALVQAGRGSGAPPALATVAGTVAGTVNAPSRPSRMPAAVFYKLQQRRGAEQQAREQLLQRTAEREEQLQQLVHSLVQAKIVAAESELEDQKTRQQAKLVALQQQIVATQAERDLLEQQQKAGQACIDEDLICCPITQTAMREPMSTPDNMHTFEREAIVGWLTLNPVNPLTREPLSFDDMHENVALRAVCDRYWARTTAVDAGS